MKFKYHTLGTFPASSFYKIISAILLALWIKLLVFMNKDWC